MLSTDTSNVEFNIWYFQWYVFRQINANSILEKNLKMKFSIFFFKNEQKKLFLEEKEIIFFSAIKLTLSHMSRWLEWKPRRWRWTQIELPFHFFNPGLKLLLSHLRLKWCPAISFGDTFPNDVVYKNNRGVVHGTHLWVPGFESCKEQNTLTVHHLHSNLFQSNYTDWSPIVLNKPLLMSRREMVEEVAWSYWKVQPHNRPFFGIVLS